MTSIDRDGTGKGFDFDLLTYIIMKKSWYLYFSGGAGSISDIEKVLKQKIININGIALASLLHYDWFSKNKLNINTPFGMSGDRINHKAFELSNLINIKNHYQIILILDLKKTNNESFTQSSALFLVKNV